MKLTYIMTSNLSHKQPTMGWIGH